MKILVALKQVPDTAAAVAIRNGAVDTSSVAWVTNPFDEFALEEALRLKDRDPGTTVHAAAAGPPRVEEMLRHALALGADEAVRVDAPADLDALPAARLLAALARRIEADLVLAGHRGVDFDRGQTGPMIAELLDWPHVGVVLAAAWDEDLEGAQFDREVEGGIERVRLSLPAVVTAQKGWNEPRLPSLKGKMAARKKTIAAMNPADLGVAEDELQPFEEIRAVVPPPPRPPGRRIDGDTVEAKVESLLRALRDEAKVL